MKQENYISNAFKITLSEKRTEKLEKLCSFLDLKKSDVVAVALDLYYEDIKKQKELLNNEQG